MYESEVLKVLRGLDQYTPSLGEDEDDVVEWKVLLRVLVRSLSLSMYVCKSSIILAYLLTIK